MSSRELERVEVMGRVGSGDLKLSDAAVMLELSYRQTKRLWRRYRQVGSQGLKHGNAGRPSNRSKALKLRRRVLNLIRKKYSGSEEERFGPTLAAVALLRAWIRKYGVTSALYTDWKNVYKRKMTPAEQLRGEVPVTQFGRMCQKLGIRIIAARSPQAKGRVERNHGIHQDRMIKKLRRKGIAGYEGANECLEKEYLPQ